MKLVSNKFGLDLYGMCTTLLGLVSKASRLIEQVLIRQEICEAVKHMTDLLTEMNLRHLWDYFTTRGYSQLSSGHSLTETMKDVVLTGRCSIEVNGPIPLLKHCWKCFPYPINNYQSSKKTTTKNVLQRSVPSKKIYFYN